jgi:acyl-CoA synthetase
MEAVAEVAVVAEPDARLGEHAAAVVSVREGMPAPRWRRCASTWPPPAWPARSGPSRSTRSRSSRGRPSGKIQKFRLVSSSARGHRGC